MDCSMPGLPVHHQSKSLFKLMSIQPSHPLSSPVSLIITFLPRKKHLLISWLQLPSAVILEPKKRKSVSFLMDSSSICQGLDAMIFIFWMLNFKLAFPLSSFTFIKRFFSSSSFSAIRVVASAYLRLFIFLPAILIPACASFNPAFCM